MPKSSRKPAANKPTKPRPDFPLYCHRSGNWAKKVRQRTCYFGKIETDPKGERALNQWLDEKDDLLAGRAPRRKGSGGLTVADLCNAFRTFKESLRDSEELAPRTYALYVATCDRLVATFRRDRPVTDLTAADFQSLRAQLAAQWGPQAVANEVQRVRCVFRYGYDAGLIDNPVRFGPGFKKPSAKVLRQAREKRGLCMFERTELLAVLEHAGINLKAMILLGINAGLGNTDLGLLPLKAVDLKQGWLDYPRPKTAIGRRVPLWPETVGAIKNALASRRDPKDPGDKHLLFIGPRGESYVGDHRGYRVAGEMTRCLTTAKIGRPGLSFYALRHTFQTVAEGAHDMAAVQAIMAHAPAASDMSSVYRERVDDDRLHAVVEHVRRWLFGTEQKK